MSQFDYDLFVIGGGSGGVRAARLAGQEGLRVALAEEFRLGGTCVIRGCVPKKLYVYASAYAEVFEEAKGFGWQWDSAPQFNWQQLVAAKNQEIARLEELYAQGQERAGVTLHRERAIFRDEHKLELLSSGRQIRAKKILIATGGRPSLQTEIEGYQHCLSSNEIFDLEHLPHSIAIAGGGYIAVEFANIFHGLGVETTLIYRGDKILRGFDGDLRDLLIQSMEEKGIRIITNALMNKVEKHAGTHRITLSNGENLQADQVLLALGRTPNTQGLGLEAAGVAVTDRGAVKVDEFGTTTQPHIFAVGDVTDRVQLTPVAIHEAMCFIETALHNRPTRPDHQMIATAVFSQPEIGTVGLSEEEAAATFDHVEIYRALFRPMRHTISGSTEKMLTKLVVDGATRRVIGAHILGADAGEMAQLLAIALKGQLTKEVFDATMAVHPTAAEELVTMYNPSYSYRNGIKQE